MMCRVLGGYLFVAYYFLLYKVIHSHAFSTALRSKGTVSPKISSCASIVDKEPSALHSVGDVQCIEVKTTLPGVGELTILEATADSQNLLVNLAAAVGGASRVVATDYEVIPLKLLDYAQDNLNPSLSLEGICCIETQLFDLCQTEVALPNNIDVFLAADVMYEPTTGKALAYRVVEALKRGSRVLIGDSPGRAGRPAFLEQLKELGVKHAKVVDVPGLTVVGDRHDLICGKNSTSVSKTPKELMVSLMELDPERDCPDS